MTVTNNLDLIQKLSEATHRIAQKYIDKPLLLEGKKFDLRFIVCVKGMHPLELFLFSKFWIRSANEPFTLDERKLFEYTTHFTVMNYGQHQLKKILCDQFVLSFEAQYKVSWQLVLHKIHALVKHTFLAADILHPQIRNTNSRAVYGIDLMIDDQFQPKLLEITYAPDCNRAV